MHCGSRFTVTGMDITLLYFEDCPNWKAADERLTELADRAHRHPVTHRLVETEEEAERVRFHGSPSILLDGVDVFAEPGRAVGLACRVYATPDGRRAHRRSNNSGPPSPMRDRIGAIGPCRSRGCRRPLLRTTGAALAGPARRASRVSRRAAGC